MHPQCCYCFIYVEPGEGVRHARFGGEDVIHERCFQRRLGFLVGRALPREIDEFRNRFPKEE